MLVFAAWTAKRWLIAPRQTAASSSEDLYALLPIPRSPIRRWTATLRAARGLGHGNAAVPVTLPLGFTAAASDRQITLAEELPAR